MKIFYSNEHQRHAPAWYVADGRVLVCPEVPGRVEGILRILAADVHTTHGVEAVGLMLGVIAAVHDAGYLEYLRTIHALWAAEFDGSDVIPDTFMRRAGMRRPTKTSAQAGYYCFDMAAPITAGTWDAAVASAACAVRAAEVVAGGERAAYALCRPPGHHAGRDYCGGFCYLNNAAIAAEVLRMKGAARVAVVDVDYHHGNGTQDIFYERGDVLFVSLHAEPETQYPYFWGYAEEIGVGAGEGTTVNFPLARGTGEGVWLATLDAAMERVRTFGAEAVVVSLGVDAFAADGVGDFGLSVGGFLEMGKRIARLGVPTVFVQEGGYNVEAVGTCVAAVLRGFEKG